MCRYCNSSNIWDDNLHWGCNHCGYSTIGGQSNPNKVLPKPELRERRRDDDDDSYWASGSDDS